MICDSGINLDGNSLTTDDFTVALNQASDMTDDLTFKEGQLLTNAEGVPTAWLSCAIRTAPAMMPFCSTLWATVEASLWQGILTKVTMEIFTL